MSRRTIAITLWSLAAFFAIGFGLTFVGYAYYGVMKEAPGPAFAITLSLLKFAAPPVGAALTAYAGRLGRLPGTRATGS